MKLLAVVTSILAVVATSQLAVANPAVILKPTAADEKQIDGIATSLFQNIKNGKTEMAINQFFASSSLMKSKTAQLQLLVSQLDGAQQIYGKVGECQEIDRTTEGSIVQYRVYVCQHDNFVSRWNLAFFKTTTGWIGANLAFKDQPAVPE